MYHEEGKVYSRKLQLAALPGKYEVTDFSKKYTEYVEEAADQEKFCRDIATWLMLLGGLIFAVGALALLFGPSRVYITHGGLTLLQFIQLYPGPIVSVGALILGVSQWVGGRSNESYMGPELYLFHSWRLIFPDGTECDEKLAVHWLEGEFFEIGLKPEAD